jgi:hypothetical protein
MVSKRPGITQWAQTLKKPDPVDSDAITATLDFLNGTDSLVLTDASSSLATISTKQGVLSTSMQASDSAVEADNDDLIYTAGYIGTTAKTEWSLRFQFKGLNLPPKAADAITTNDTFIFRAAEAGTGYGKEFAIWSGGIYYKTATSYTLISGSANAGSSKWVTIEVRCDTAGSTNVYLDDTLLTTTALTSSDLADVTLDTTGALFEFGWEAESDGDTHYTTRISTVMYNDESTDPFTEVAIDNITGFQYTTAANSPKRALLAGAGDYVYHDNGLEGVWRPLAKKSYSNLEFTSYRETIVWVDHDNTQNSVLSQWNGRDDIVKLTDAPLITSITEHQQRLWGVGPGSNRVYYSGDRQPNVWYSPSDTNVEDEFDTALTAGYIEIPLKHGDRNITVFGDYYNTVLVFTRRGVWQISGSGLFSWARRSITQKYGCDSPYGVTEVDNQVWFLSNRGVVAIVPTGQYGDLAAQIVSTPIVDLWGRNPSSEQIIAKDYLKRGIMEYNPLLGLLYVSVPLTSDTYPNKTYIFSSTSKGWLGPWEITQRCMVSAEIGPPTREVMMHGTANGQIGYTDIQDKSDWGSTAIEFELESPILNGRSLESVVPGITYMKKSWRTLRLWILPRGDWDIDVTWWADAEQSSGSVTKTQKVFDNYVLDTDFRFDVTPDGAFASPEELGYIEVDLDKSGYGLYFNITQDTIGEDLAIQGYEVDFVIEGYEES